MMSFGSSWQFFLAGLLGDRLVIFVILFGEGHDHLAAGSGHPQELAGDGFGVLEVLPAGDDQGGVNARVRQR